MQTMQTVTVVSDDGERAAFDPYYGFESNRDISSRRAMELYAKAALHHPGHFIPVRSMIENVMSKKEGIVFRFKQQYYLLRQTMNPIVTKCRQLPGGNWSFSMEEGLNPVELRLVVEHLRSCYPHLVKKQVEIQH